jgi:hypothetical protein
MGWPKKNEDFRLYYEAGSKTYLLVSMGETCPDGCREAIGELLIDNDPEKPNLCSTSVSSMHIYKKCKRVQWDEMPQVWQDKLGEYINGDPKTCRGLWRIKK